MDEFAKIGHILKQKTGTVILGGVLVAALSFAFLVLSQKNFQANTQFLIVQDQRTGPQDFFSLSKSVEYTGKVMSEAIYSQLFIDEVVRTEKLDEEFLPFNQKDRLKEWSKMIGVSRDPQLGIISVTVYHDDQGEALRISEAIIKVFAERNYLFRGSGQDIDFRVLSGPILEKNPSLSSIMAAALGGFMLGMLIILAVQYYKGEELTDELLVLSRKEKVRDNRMEPMSPEEYEESLKYLNR